MGEKGEERGKIIPVHDYIAKVAKQTSTWIIAYSLLLLLLLLYKAVKQLRSGEIYVY